VPLLLGEPRKREREVAGVGSSMAKRQSKDIIIRIKPKELDNSNFNTCWHAVEWSKNEGEEGDHYIQMSGYLLAKAKTPDDTAEYNFTVKTFTVTKLFIKISTPKILSTSIISRFKFENSTYI
jgi:hypothetical protein